VRVSRDLGTQRSEVERGGHSQRPGQRPAPFGRCEAGDVAVQMSPTSREPTRGVGLGGAVLCHHAQELRRGRALAAADAGALRPGGDGHPQVAGSGDGTGLSVGSMFAADLPAGSMSGRMSMRHPVRRAASRAFCPSRPMASESW
jgi:hypothetical protein